MSQIKTKFIANNAVTNAILAQAPTMTLKGNNTGSTANELDLTVSQVQTMLAIPTSSSPLAIGSGGTGQTTASAAFNALAPATATGGLIRGTGTNTYGNLAIGSTGNVLTVSGGTAVWAAPATSGTVTSVAFADASTTPIYTITGSPVTTSGTLTQTLATQTANTIFAGPSSGSAAQPSFRALVSADIPNNASNTTGTAANITATSNSTLTTLSALSLPGSQVTGNISGNAANVTGTVAVANGGTGDTSFTAYAPVIGGTTSTGALQSASSGISNSGYVLTSTGSSSAPTWQAASGASFHAPTFQIFNAGGGGSGTYTRPTSPTPLYIVVTAVGAGGGGGSGVGTSGAAAGANGGNTTFGSSSLIVANGGKGGPAGSSANAVLGGAGGTASSTLSSAFAFSGGAGMMAYNINGTLGGNSPGGNGGANANGGTALASLANTNGASPAGNTGAGGGGGGSSTSSSTGGGGGGAGGWVKAFITSPSATYTYATGGGGAGGTHSGSSAGDGGTGTDGMILVEEYYQ